MSDGFLKTKQPLILTNVLCVPSFSFSLISISQLAKTILCWLIFFGNMCFIQDLAHWSAIGLGREFKGLYLLEESLSTSRNCFFAAGFVNNLVVQPSIQHFGLGHLSNAKSALIRYNNVPLSNTNQEIPCEICPLAKQKRLPFTPSTYVSLECFELIHCDLQGSFSAPTIDEPLWMIAQGVLGFIYSSINLKLSLLQSYFTL